VLLISGEEGASFGYEALERGDQNLRELLAPFL
jgi:hypothetical protein